MIRFFSHPKHPTCLYWTTAHGKTVALDLETGYVLSASIIEDEETIRDEEFTKRMQCAPFVEVRFS